MKKEIFLLAFLLMGCTTAIDSAATTLIAPAPATTAALTRPVINTVLPSTAVPPTPTLTLTPSPIPSATLTLTPNATPTPDPNLNVKEEVYNDQFTGKSGWLWTFKDDVAEFGAVNGELRAKAKASNKGWRYSLRFDKKFSEVQAQVTAKVAQCGDNDEYGFAFRGTEAPKDQFNMYVFKITCAGAARVEKLEGTSSTTLVNWKTYPALAKGKEAQNLITLWLFKDQFHFFANDKYLFSLQDSSFPEGYFGFYLNDRTSGTASLTFTNFVVKAIKP